MRALVLSVALAVLPGCNALAGLDALGFDGEPSSGASGVGGDGAGTTAAGGNGPAMSSSAASGGAAPCGVNGPYDVGVAGDVTTVPFIAALGPRWGIAWRVGDSIRFVTVDGAGEVAPQVPAGLSAYVNQLASVTASKSFFYLGSSGDDAYPGGAIHRFDTLGEEVAVLPIDGSSFPLQMRPEAREDGVLVALMADAGFDNFDVAVIDDTSAAVTGLAAVPGVELSCCSSRDWRAVAYTGGFAVAADTPEPDKLVSLSAAGAAEFVDDQADVPIASGVALGGDVYFASSSTIWHCTKQASSFDCESKLWSGFDALTTDAASLWATASGGGLIAMQRYDYDQGPLTETIAFDAEAVSRPVFAFNGDAWGVAWLERSTIKFATAKYCEP